MRGVTDDSNNDAETWFDLLYNLFTPISLFDAGIGQPWLMHNAENIESRRPIVLSDR